MRYDLRLYKYPPSVSLLRSNLCQYLYLHGKTQIIQVNLTASFILARSLAKHWLSGPTSPSPDKKKIINIASVLTFSGSLNICAYVATKGAIGQLTKALSNEWMGKGICVTALAPGYIATELTEGIRTDKERESAIIGRVPAGRWGVPEDLAGAIVYLASRARYVILPFLYSRKIHSKMGRADFWTATLRVAKCTSSMGASSRLSVAR